MYIVDAIRDGYRDLRCVDLRGVDLRGEDLRGANLQYANLQYANLQYANLRDADFRGANLRGANLQYADFRDADFRDADLRGADLQYTNFRDANFRGANLRGTRGLLSRQGNNKQGDNMRSNKSTDGLIQTVTRTKLQDNMVYLSEPDMGGGLRVETEAELKDGRCRVRLGSQYNSWCSISKYSALELAKLFTAIADISEN